MYICIYIPRHEDHCEHLSEELTKNNLQRRPRAVTHAWPFEDCPN